MHPGELLKYFTLLYKMARFLNLATSLAFWKEKGQVFVC